MFTAQPMPDEYYRGNIERLSHINFFESSLDYLFNLQLLLDRRPKGQIRKPYLVIVADALKIPVKNYLLLHSFLPLTNFAVKPNEQNPLTIWSNRIISAHKYMYNRKGCYFCDRCIEEDISFWGYSYWRRSHQMPGCYWCEKHNSYPLRLAPDGTAFKCPPSYWYTDSAFKIPSQANQYVNNDAIRKFLLACQNLLDSPYTLEIQHIKHKSLKRVGLVGLVKLIQEMKGMPPSKILLEQYPIEFLEEIIPDFFYTFHDRISFPMDELTNRYFRFDNSCVLLLLILCVYDSLEEYVNQWESPIFQRAEPDFKLSFST